MAVLTRATWMRNARLLPFVWLVLPGAAPASGHPATIGEAGTPWLTVTAPVVPGEIIELDLMIFDVSDTILDSLALFDNFRWVPLPP